MYLETLAQALALRILELHGSEDATGHKRGGLTSTRLRTVPERMHIDFTRNSTTTGLANLAGLSVDHFVRTFRSAIGEPPHRYLLRERIHEAQRLLSQAVLRGISVGPRRALEDMIRAFDSFKLRPVIDAVYSFAGALAAYDHLYRGAFGKIVIRVKE